MTVVDPRSGLLAFEPRIRTLGFLNAPAQEVSAAVDELCAASGLAATSDEPVGSLTEAVDAMHAKDADALNAMVFSTANDQWSAILVNPERLFDLGGVFGLLTKSQLWQGIQLTHVDRRWDMGRAAAPDRVACEYQHVYSDGVGHVFPRVVGWRMSGDSALDFYEVGVRRSYEHLESYSREDIYQRLQRTHLEYYARQLGIDLPNPGFYRFPAQVRSFCSVPLAS